MIAACAAALAACANVDPPPSTNGGEGIRTPPNMESLMDEAEGVYRADLFDSANTLWSDILRSARELHDSVAEARALTSLALTSRMLGAYEDARHLAEKAVSVQRQYLYHAMLPRTFNALGLIAWNAGRYHDAVALFDTTESLAKAIDNERYVGVAAGNRGLVLLELGELDDARAGLWHQRDVGREIGDPVVEANAFLNLGVVEIRAGNPRLAVVYLDSALPLYGPDESYEREILIGHMADAYSLMGDHQGALMFLDSALLVSRKLGVKQEEAANLFAFGEVYAELGDLRRALDYLHQAAAMYEELGFADELAGIALLEAQIHDQLGSSVRAHEFALRAFEGHVATGALFAALDDALFLAELAADRGDERTAAEFLSTADSLAERQDSHGSRVALALTRARVAESLGDHQGVVEAIHPVITTITDGGFNTEWEAFTLLARAYLDLGDVDRGLEFAERATFAADRIQGAIGSSDLRATHGGATLAAYHALIDALLASGRAAEAFYVVNRATPTRATNDRRRRHSERETTLSERLRQLDLAIAANRADPYTTVESLRGLEREVRETRGEFERLRATYSGRTESPNSVGQIPRVQPRTGDAVLTLFTNGDHLHVFGRTVDSVVHVAHTITTADLMDRVRMFQGLVANPDVPAELSHPAGAWLFDRLIRPVTDAAPIERLFVVPNGVPTYVPFDALWDSARDSYLGASIEVSALATVGDYDPDPARLEMATATLMAPLDEELPGSRAEVDAIHGLIGGDVHYGSAATEARLRAALETSDIVHVATHGILNARNPMFSRIETAHQLSPTAIDDGRLEVHEVYGLDIHAGLVFLSGCETGLGAAWATTFGAGDEYRTLAESFLQAGAGAVIATLWPIEDSGATAFALAFYAAVRHSAPADALAEARRVMMSHDRYSHPFYWAGYRITSGNANSAAQNSTAVSVSR